MVADKEGFTEEWNCEDSTMTNCDGCTTLYDDSTASCSKEGSDCSAVDFE